MSTPHPLKAGYKAATLWVTSNSLSLLWRISLLVVLYQFVAIGSRSPEANRTDFVLAGYAFVLAFAGTRLASWLLNIWMPRRVVKRSWNSHPELAEEESAAIADIVVRLLRALILIGGIVVLNPLLDRAELTTAFSSAVVVAGLLALTKIFIQHLRDLLTTSYRWIIRIDIAEAIASLLVALMPNFHVVASAEFYQFLIIWGLWIGIFYGIRFLVRIYLLTSSRRSSKAI